MNDILVKGITLRPHQFNFMLLGIHRLYFWRFPNFQKKINLIKSHNHVTTMRATRPLPLQRLALLVRLSSPSIWCWQKELPLVSGGSPLFAKTQYPVCLGPVLMKQA